MSDWQRKRMSELKVGDQVKSRVVVLGAGYAGLLAAKRIARQVRSDEVELTLVSGSASFVERPRLHQLAVGQDIRIVPLSEYLDGTAVHFRQGWVTGIDLTSRVVTVSSPSTSEVTRDLPFDILIYALGSNIDVDSVPGVRQHTAALTSTEAAATLREVLPGINAQQGKVAVCGTGLTGIEVATEIAESYPGVSVQLLGVRPPGEWLSDKARAYLADVMSKLDIDVIRGARVGEVQDGRFVLADGRHVVFDAAVWAGGFRVPTLAEQAGLAVAPDGRASVGSDLCSVSHPDVYVIGDAAAVAGPWGEQIAMGCRTGGFTAPKAADAVVARLTGHEVAPLKFRYIHECISLGRKRGLVQFLNADETPKDRILTGRKAITYKNITLNGARFVFRRSGPMFARRRHVIAAPVAVRSVDTRNTL